MIHVKKINEMQKPKKDLAGLVLGFDDTEYAITLDGLLAIYRALYNGEIEIAVDFFNYMCDKKIYNDEQISTMENALCEFVYGRIMEEVSERRFLETIYHQDYANYLGSGSKMFVEYPDSRYDEWVRNVAEMTGIRLPNE